MRCLLEGGVYFSFPFPNAAFIRGRRLKDEIRYLKDLSNIYALNIEIVAVTWVSQQKATRLLKNIKKTASLTSLFLPFLNC